ncbi:unnamed protein product, partial [Nesidiocoris tenuis]
TWIWNSPGLPVRTDLLQPLGHSKWKYWNRPKIENRNGASEKTFSQSNCSHSGLRQTSRALEKLHRIGWNSWSCGNSWVSRYSRVG